MMEGTTLLVLKTLAAVSAAVLLAACQRSGQEPQATVLYFNDAHQIMPVVDELGQRGGVARLKTVVERVRRHDPEAFVVLGGDLGGGALFGAVFKGFPMVEAFNELPLDLASFGQHDFDFGADNARQLVEASQFPWITSNLVDGDGRPFAGLPTHLVRELGGLRLGFLGLTDAMDTTTQEGRVFQRGLADSARAAVQEMGPRSLDAVIAVTQAGLEANERLLAEVPEISAVLTEERLEDRSLIHYVGSRPIIAPCGNMGSVVRLDIAKRNGDLELRLKVYPVDDRVAGDSKMALLEERYLDRMEAELGQSLALLESRLDSPIQSGHANRWRETALGNLVADAFRSHHGADVGIINGGGIRAGLESGQISMKDALAVLPFDNSIYLVEASGMRLRQAIEHGLASAQRKSGAFLQISGIRFEVDWDRPPGDRLVRVRVGEAELEHDRLYTLALPSYLAQGGDGHEALARCPVRIGPQQAPKDIEVFAAHLRRLGATGPIQARAQGRILARGRP